MGCDCGCKGCGGFLCQSCGMPMEEPEDFGINKDGSKNNDYCNFCFQEGEFTDEGVTVEQKADKIARMLAEIKGRTEEQARQMAAEALPQLKKLKRWNK